MVMKLAILAARESVDLRGSALDLLSKIDKTLQQVKNRISNGL